MIKVAKEVIVLFCLVVTLIWADSISESNASQIGEVTVTSMGFGSTPASAAQDALVNAIAQVNGEAVAASTKLKQTSTTVSSTETGDSRSIERQIQEEVNRKTKGVVKSWRVNSVDKSESGDFSATVNAVIVVLQKSAQLDRLKIAIVSPKSALQPFTGELGSNLSQLLTSSRKFAVLDRKNSEVIEAQLDGIRQGRGQIADQVRLISEVAPDLLIVVGVEESAGRDGRRNLFGTLEVVDYSTRQVRFSDRKMIVIDPSKPSSVKVRVSALARMLSRSVLETAFPPTVIGFSENLITIGQGKDFFSVGDDFVLYELGNELRDPHTKEFLSHERKELGGGKITYTDARISQGSLQQAVAINQSAIAGRKIVVSRKSPSAEGGSVNQSSRKSSLSSLLDDEE
jgi:hypothetical protein